MSSIHAFYAMGKRFSVDIRVERRFDCGLPPEILHVFKYEGEHNLLASPTGYETDAWEKTYVNFAHRWNMQYVSLVVALTLVDRSDLAALVPVFDPTDTANGPYLVHMYLGMLCGCLTIEGKRTPPLSIPHPETEALLVLIGWEMSKRLHGGKGREASGHFSSSWLGHPLLQERVRSVEKVLWANAFLRELWGDDHDRNYKEQVVEPAAYIASTHGVFPSFEKVPFTFMTLG